MTSTAILVLAAQQILIYGGLLIILMGMFGSLMAIFIFTQRPFSQNPCSIYLVVNALLSFLFLPIFFLPRILTLGFQIECLAFSTSFCKFQASYGVFTVTSIFVINCFISFDRYAMSSRSVRMRAFSSKKVTRILLVVGLGLIWCLFAIPVAVLFDSIPTSANGPNICTSKSRAFLLFAALVYYPLLEGLLPMILAIYFWRVTRKQVYTLKNQNFIRHFDKQMTKMYFFRIIVSAVASLPYAAMNLYIEVTVQAVRTEDQENVVKFIRLLTIWLFYLQFCTDFYIYVLTSSEIQEQAKRILCFWRRRRNNSIAAVQIHIPPAQQLKKKQSWTFS